MDLTKQEAIQLLTDLGIPEVAFGPFDPGAKWLKAMHELGGLEKCHEEHLLILLTFLEPMLVSGMLETPKKATTKKTLQMVLGNLKHSIVRVRDRPQPPRQKPKEEVQADHEFEKLIAKFASVDPQSDEWEKIAGGYGILVGDQILFPTGASTAANTVNSVQVRRLPPRILRQRLELVEQYWSIRLRRANFVMTDIREKHHRREGAPSREQIEQARLARKELVHCRQEQAKARERLEKPKPTGKSIHEVRAEAIEHENEMNARAMMDDLLRI